MRLMVIGSVCLLFFAFAAGNLAGRASTQESKGQAQQGSDTPAPISAEDAAKKNPVKPTPEGLTAAKKLFGYHCAMCHGTAGDGKGEVAEDMKLKLKDWRDPSSLGKMTDGELFYVVTNGRGKMVGGEGDRTSEEVRWNLVNYVRSFAKKDAAVGKP